MVIVGGICQPIGLMETAQNWHQEKPMSFCKASDTENPDHNPGVIMDIAGYSCYRSINDTCVYL